MSHSSHWQQVKRPGRKDNASFWKRHVKAWRASGLSRAEYCRRHNLSYYGLTYWYRKLKRTGSNPGTCAIVPVMSLEAVGSRPGTPIRIRFRQHFTIEIDADFDAAVLSKLIAVLEA